MSYMKQKKKHKQTFESVQYRLEIIFERWDICVLKAAVVECGLIPSINPRLTIDQHSIDTSDDT